MKRLDGMPPKLVSNPRRRSFIKPSFAMSMIIEDPENDSESIQIPSEKKSVDKKASGKIASFGFRVTQKPQGGAKNNKSSSFADQVKEIPHGEKKKKNESSSFGDQIKNLKSTSSNKNVSAGFSPQVNTMTQMQPRAKNSTSTVTQKPQGGAKNNKSSSFADQVKEIPHGEKKKKNESSSFGDQITNLKSTSSNKNVSAGFSPQVNTMTQMQPRAKNSTSTKFSHHVSTTNSSSPSSKSSKNSKSDNSFSLWAKSPSSKNSTSTTLAQHVSKTHISSSSSTILPPPKRKTNNTFSSWAKSPPSTPKKTTK